MTFDKCFAHAKSRKMNKINIFYTIDMARYGTWGEGVRDVGGLRGGISVKIISLQPQKSYVLTLTFLCSIRNKT